MAKILKADFSRDFSSGIVNDAATQARITATGVTNGKALLDGADADKNGKIEGAELDGLWKKIDDFDRDGNAGSVSGTSPLALIGALRPRVAGSVLTRGDKGPEVEAAQNLLINLGYYTGEKGADADFGKSTLSAVQQFQSDYGLPVTSVIDAPTLKALKDAKPVYPEYDQMFQDGVLQTTIGLGFDEDDNDLWVKRDVIDGLVSRGFTRITDAKELEDRKLDPNGVYYKATFSHGGKEVTGLVRVVDRDSRDAKAQFAKGMANDDLVLYTGHGRRGSGPDFDRDSSAAGNFVIGKPSEEGHYALGENDVDKRGSLSKGYQLMHFDGCNTKWYADDFRRNKGDNLDLLLSNTELPWSTSAVDVLATLDGVMKGESMPQIKKRLDDLNAASNEQGKPFRADGFRNNKYRPGI